MNKILVSIVIVVAIVVVVGFAPVVSTHTPYDTNHSSYEVTDVYTTELTAGYQLVSTTTGARFDPLPKANVEIKNTGDGAGLFRVHFFFSEEYAFYTFYIFFNPFPIFYNSLNTRYNIIIHGNISTTHNFK